MSTFQKYLIEEGEPSNVVNGIDTTPTKKKNKKKKEEIEE